MEQVLLKLISILNKPIHFFIVGIALLIWGIFFEPQRKNYITLTGLIFLSISISSFVEYFYNKIKLQNNNKVLSNLYKNLSLYESLIIDHCLSENNLSYYCYDPDYYEAMLSLISKGFGTQNDNYFVMDINIYKRLKVL